MPPRTTRTKTRTYIIEPYGMDLSVHVVPEPTPFTARGKDGLAPATGESVWACVAFDRKTDPNRIEVWIRPDAPPSIIAHESLHVTTAVARSRSFPIRWGQDEPAAYLLQWVFEAIDSARL